MVLSLDKDSILIWMVSEEKKIPIIFIEFMLINGIGEKIITKEERNEEYLKKIVRDIFDVFNLTEEVLKKCPTYFILTFQINSPSP